MKNHQKRLVLILVGLSFLGLAVFFVLSAFQRNLVFFFTPTQIFTGQAPKKNSFRVGGMVERGSLQRQQDGITVSFVVTDLAKKIRVIYRGALPDLFKEGKGVVAQGRLNDQDIFVAEEVLAKHDENYMPPDAAYALTQVKNQVDTGVTNTPTANVGQKIVSPQVLQVFQAGKSEAAR